MSQRTGFSAPAFLLVMAAVCPANGQAAPASLPTPLVTALIDDGGSAAGPYHEYSVETLPTGYPAALVPSGPVRIVGGMTTGDQIIAVFADSTRRLAAVFEQLFEQAGFTRPAPSPGSGFSSASGPYSFYCRDSAMVVAQPLTGPERDFVRVTYRRPRGYSACGTLDRAQSRDELQLPELMPPTGAHVRRSGGGAGGGEVHSSAEMTGMGLVPSTVLAHYARQLVAAGWTAAAPAVSERLAAQFFEAKDASGAPWEGVLMTVGSGTAMQVSLTMNPRSKP